MEKTASNKKLLSLAIPMGFEGLMTASADLLDTLMVSSLGETAVSAAGLGTQIFFIQSMTIYGFGGGASTYMSQFFGSDNNPGIRRTLSICLRMSFLLSLLLFLIIRVFPGFIIGIFTNIDEVKTLGIEYILFRSPGLLVWSITLPLIMALKSMQRAVTAVSISVFGIIANLGLNYTLIYGKFGFPEMGVAGAALATCLAQTLELIVLLAVLVITKNPLVRNMTDYINIGKDLTRDVIKNSVPTTINEMMWSAGMSAYNAAYGRISIAASAAAQASDIVTHVFSKTIYGFGDAVLILVGEMLGRGRIEEAYNLAKRLLKLNTVLGGATGLLLIILSYTLASLFGFEGEAFRFLIILLIINGLFLPLKMYNATLVTGVLRAGGDTRYAMITEVSSVWFIGVPIVFIIALVFKLPVYFVLLGAEAEDIIKCIILTKRFRSKIWAKNRVEKY